ncbi:Sec-independent protein translocase subunit TatA [Streptomyces sp. NBC_01310]|uniref:Sec-independent protein translocase subunit TatA n=1 Tax=Streptomyces sp. NBC_01310 TaxID=2903820 RepID=UPI0035B5FA43|nr:Sec-independent protein translocase subunit TatA [Streptomyces sp. NBC_01310]WSJ63754.1 Sec-independent protein translocase subunit TatA [Streptomyces sp. NBC_01310]
MFGKLGAPEILLILVAVILLFGAKRLPDMARSLGQSMRILKTETKAMRTREDETTAQGPSAARADDASRTASQHTLEAVPGLRDTAVAAARSQEAVGTR